MSLNEEARIHIVDSMYLGLRRIVVGGGILGNRQVPRLNEDNSGAAQQWKILARGRTTIKIQIYQGVNMLISEICIS